jgi:hypothetical protein
LFFWCILKPPVKSRFLKKPTKRFDGGEKRRTRHTRHFFFLAHQTRATRPRLYIYIYTSHTHKFESSNHAFDDNQHLVSFGQTAFLVFLEAPHEEQPKRRDKINVKVAAMSNVSRNPNMAQLRAGYLFPEIARIRNAHLEKNPDAKIISLGIGDTTVRFCFVFFAFFDLILSD